MPSPEFHYAPEERGPGPRPEPNESEPLPYAKAAKFERERHAKKAYDATQEAIFKAKENVDLSTYRLILDRVWHVAVIGQPPPEEMDRRLGRILSTGESTELPADVLSELLARRAEAAQLGPWVELHREVPPHYRPPEPRGGGQS